MATPTSASTSTTSQLLLELTQNLDRATTLTTGLSTQQFNWQPEPGRWSIAQCVSHLNLVDGTDLESIRAVIADARARNLTSPGPFRYGPLNRYFIRLMEPPVTRKFKAPKYYEPPPDADPATTMDEFRRIQTTLTDLVRQADGLDLARIKIPFVNIKWFKMQLGARLHLLAAHGRRHLWQAEAVRAHPDFPS